MNTIWLSITSVLSVTSVFSDRNIDISHIRVFPAVNQSIAGVFQVSSLNDLNQPHYAFNVSEARTLCLSLGVNIASRAQVEEALTQGLETCRFGWIDEHSAVIPRIQALAICGRNQTGLVQWRAPVTHKFDVFCFNESATQLKDTATDSPLSNYSGHTRSPSKATDFTQTTHSTSSTSSTTTPKTIDSEAEPARFVGKAKGSAGGKVVLITCTCALLLTAVIILAYLKLRRRSSLSSDMKQQQEEYIETEEWTCVRNITETKKAVQEEERLEVGDDAQ